MTAITEGKTKRILPGPEPGTIILETKDHISAGDGAKVDSSNSLGYARTSQAANIFTLLNRRGIPTAYRSRAGETALLCDACDMLPLELVVRRRPWGSYLKRYPDLHIDQNKPAPFDEPVVETFHKLALIVPPLVEEPAMKTENALREKYLQKSQWAEGVYTDPYLDTSAPGFWGVYKQKAPVSGAPLHRIEPVIPSSELSAIFADIVVPAFLALEEAWSDVITEDGPVMLADCKMEVGKRKSDGKYVLADVIDNDSWRIWPGGLPANQLDKQSFRDGAGMAEVCGKYALVTRLTQQFLDD